MKQFNLLSAVAVFMLAQFLFSCSPSGSESFAKRKYFDYKWDKKEYAKVETEKAPSAADAPAVEESIIEGMASAEPAPIEEKSISENEEQVIAPSRKGTKDAVEEQRPSMSFNESELSFGEKMIVKKLEKAAQKENKGNKPSIEGEDILILILCFLLPPLAVFIKSGISTDFWITLLLTLFFWLPGVVFAIYVCFFK